MNLPSFYHYFHLLWIGGIPPVATEKDKLNFFFNWIKSKYPKLCSGKVRCIGIEKTLYLLAGDVAWLAVQRRRGGLLGFSLGPGSGGRRNPGLGQGSLSAAPLAGSLGSR